MSRRGSSLEQLAENRKTGMEKFQNLLRGFGNFMVGMPSKEEVDEIRKNNPQMDIFKNNTQLEKEGKVRNEQGNVVDSTTGIITKSGNKQGTFSSQDYLNEVGEDIMTDVKRGFRKFAPDAGDAMDGGGSLPYDKNKKDASKIPSFKDVMGMEFGKYLDKVAQVGEQAKNKDALRSGISSLAYSPLIGSQAAMDAAANIGQLTGVNMAAIANQGSVMAQNPTKQKIAGKYFR